tara:strand:+ start:2671 stop:2793 length:123 start_codon:yes stop_codon:yes gene_type:complete
VGIIIRNSLNKIWIFASMFSAGQIRALAEQVGTSNLEMLN